MIESRSLKFYPKIDSVLSKTLQEQIANSLHSAISNPSVRIPAFIRIYSCFIDITSSNQDPVTNYSAIKELNSDKAYHSNLKLFFSFLVNEFKYKDTQASTYVRILATALTSIKSNTQYDKLIQPNEIKFSLCKLDLDEQETYQRTINQKKLKYYSGWGVFDCEGKYHRVYLAYLYDVTDENFTNFVISAMNDLSITKHGETLRGTLLFINNIFKDIVFIYKSRENIILSLHKNNLSQTFESIFNLRLYQLNKSGKSISTFIKYKFPSCLEAFNQCFIYTKILEEPERPFIVPTFKSIKASGRSVNTGTTTETKERLLTNIPSEIKDDEALAIIEERVNSDINHIIIYCESLIDTIDSMHKRNEAYKESGIIKRPPKPGGAIIMEPDIGRINSNLPFGIKHINNTVATFYHYGFGAFNGYNRFLSSANNFMSNTDYLKELNLPTLETLMPYLMLLVYYHPEITPQFFINWELFDKNGRKVGIKETGNITVIQSYKKRRGPKKAQQIIPLTKNSKQIVDKLIEHTAYARQFLKGIGNDNWRYILLTCPNISSPPKRLVRFPRKESSMYGNFYKGMCEPSYLEGNQILSDESARQLSKLAHLRPLRANMALKTYFDTGSTLEVHKVLGHESKDIELLECYLPDVLLDFFRDRDIRNFQNALIYEAMKDSDLLLDSLDSNIININQFFENHGLKEIPNQLKVISEQSKTYSKKKFDEIRLLISIPLLQIMNCIRNEFIKFDEKDISSNMRDWINISNFVIQHIELSKSGSTKNNLDPSILEMFNQAMLHPIRPGALKYD